MPFRVDVRQIAEPIAVGQHESILEAALRAGHAYPFGCREGVCGSCKSVLLRGHVNLAPYSHLALSERELNAGLILACRAMPRTDCVVAWVDPDEPALHPRRRVICQVLARERLTAAIVRLRISLMANGPFEFSAGQFAALTFAGQPPRDFSMANRPGDPFLEFFIGAVEGGRTSRYAAEVCRPGELVRLEGPYGISYLREKHKGPIVALAGGSGLAPIKSIVEQALTIGMRQPITLYFGVRDEPDLFLVDHFLDLARTHPGFRFIPVLSEPAQPTSRRTGFLADALLADFPTLKGVMVYMAGPPAMLESCMAMADRLGAHPEDCHGDAFYTEAEKAKLGEPVAL
jgi:CDP-4-dehydro-6-deoxyglucose reductase/ferredoxin-NAD(P)+ reductase (naphthalene dioxygenase ferredoxin-specific)